MKTLSIDIETYSDVPLQKSGVYRYCESLSFEILLFGYSIDSGPVQVVDLACGEEILSQTPGDRVVRLAYDDSRRPDAGMPSSEGLSTHAGLASFMEY